MAIYFDKNSPRLQMDTPFQINLSFEPLFEYWEKMAASEDKGKAGYGQSILNEVAHAKELRKPFKDLALVEKYEKEISILLSPFFPEQLTNNEIKAASVAFTPIYFNPSERFRNILEDSGGDFNMDFINTDNDTMYVYACLYLLMVYYGRTIEFKRPYFFEIPNKKTGLTKYYRALINGDFIKIKPTDQTPDLSDEDINELLDNFDDVALWKSKIPPNSFIHEGFALITMFDITLDEAISEMKMSLLDKSALINTRKVKKLQSQLRTIFSIPKLKFGFAFIDHEYHRIRKLGHQHSSSLILHDQEDLPMNSVLCAGMKCTVFDTSDSMVLPDISKADVEKDPFLASLLEQGIKSYICSPVVYNDKTIGILELGAPQARQLNSVVLDKLVELMPMFSVALKRSLDDYKTKIEAIIQSNFTAIHPAVSWRFYEAAERLMDEAKKHETIEPIVFDEVYPLYGQSDIKDSSKERSKAIAADLVEQLEMAREVIDKAERKQAMPIFDSIRFNLNEAIEGLKDGMNAGDEVSVLDFLQEDVYPIFNHLKNENARLRKAVEKYMNQLDPELNILYKRRKAYERSVSMINENIAEYLEKQQLLAQEMFPHYFEKFQTDGVEHTIYVGQSLTKKANYDDLFLHNLRLWQLLIVCGTENLVRKLQSKLPVFLEVASMLLVHSSPMAISFRLDEKKFDVDGAYNIRYAIIKKRIDKAYIKGTKERLTQTGKIAIVYSQDKDAVEYRKYLEYLASIGKVGSHIEDLELQELQGANGLRALRVDVLYEDEQEVDMKKIEAAVVNPTEEK